MMRDANGGSTSFRFISVGQFAPEEHSIVAQGVPDDEAPLGKSEHECKRTRPERLNDFTTTVEHRLATPRRQTDVMFVPVGVPSDVRPDDARSERRELKSLVFNDSDFDLSFANAVHVRW